MIFRFKFWIKGVLLWVLHSINPLKNLEDFKSVEGALVAENRSLSR